MVKTPCSKAGGQGLIPGQGTISHMLQLKILSVTTKTGTVKQIIKKKKTVLPILKVTYKLGDYVKIREAGQNRTE